jgi:hypothetical protein
VKGVFACFGRVKKEEQKGEQKRVIFSSLSTGLPQLKLVNLLTRHGDKAE